MLQNLNTRAVANTGLAIGGAAIGAAVTGLFKILSDPDELVALYEAAHTHTDPSRAVAKLAGAGIAVVGALVLALLASYQGRPSTIPCPGDQPK